MKGEIDGDRWARIETLFLAASKLPPGDRSEYVRRACGDDPSLRAQIDAMLATDDSDSDFLDITKWMAALSSEQTLVAETEDRATPGSKIGKYQLIEQIGDGGMGTVWSAERVDGAYEQKVAIKLIKRGMDTDDVLRRFRLEKQLLARLQHPNIARLLDGGSTPDGRPWLAMEFIDGKPIDIYCDEHQYTIYERLRLFAKVCKTVHDAHRNLVVHRDLKPANILATQDGEPKLLDFGIAKLLESEHSPAVTRLGRRVLTPRFASPEQIRGEAVTTAMDVYSLGVVLYQLITGRHPYVPKSDSIYEVERAVCDDEPIRPSTAVTRGSHSENSNTISEIASRRKLTPASLRRTITGDLDHIILKAIAKTPDARYGSAQQLADDIQRWLDGLPVQARSIGLHRRLIRAMKRNRRTMIATTVGTVVGLVLMAVVMIYIFLVPVWVNHSIDRARLELLDPQQSNSIYVNVYWGQAGGETMPAGPESMERALAHYNSALRLAPGRDDLRLERDAVQASLDLIANRSPKITPCMLRNAPNLAAHLQQSKTLDVDLRNLDRIELRTLGLIAMLTADVNAGSKAWSSLEFTTEPDPLIEGMSGILYLAQDDAERAYPRLMSAHRALPEAGFLCVHLADAAAHCGDVEIAQQLLQHARTLPKFDDGTEGTLRVEADVLKAAGRIDEAIALYERTRDSPVGWSHYADIYLKQGRTREALTVYTEAISCHTNWYKLNAEFLQLADQWWDGLSDAERMECMNSKHDRCLEYDSFAALLFAHRIATMSNATIQTHSPNDGRAIGTTKLSDLSDAIHPLDALGWLHAFRKFEPRFRDQDMPMIERIETDFRLTPGQLTPETRELVDAWDLNWRQRNTTPDAVTGYNGRFAFYRGPIELAQDAK